MSSKAATLRTTPPHATVADALAEEIALAGIAVAYAFPGGGSNLELMEALRHNGVEVVLTRSEGGGAFMAAAGAELSGTPGVVIVGVGPGLASVVNGVAHAFLDRVPLLVIADRYSDAEARTSGHQLIDHAALLAPVTKDRLRLSASSAREQLAAAVATATQSPAGPVLLELGRDVATIAAGGARPTAVRPARAPQPLEAAALATLVAARRPVVLVGLEAREVPQSDLVALVERLRAPTLSTYKGKGAFPESHPFHAGLLTGAEIERPWLERADVLLAVGVDPVELLTRDWLAQAPIVALRAAAAPDEYLRPRWSCTGELPAAVASLAANIEGGASEWQPALVAREHAETLARLRLPAPGSLASWEIVEAVQEELAGAIVAVDAGAHMFAATSFWRAAEPGSFLISNGLATMGFAVPAAIAAARARPDRTVVAFTGDGGFMLHGNELETAARLGAKVIVVVLNDAGLSLIRIKQEDKGFERAGVDYLASDLALLARALGAAGWRASTRAELIEAIRAARAEPGSSVIDVTLTGSEYRELQRMIRG